MRGAPYIADVKRNSLDDGPGIRSVVFFKGCPLRCVWCQNPETLSLRPEIQRSLDRCTSCGDCALACPEQVARTGRETEERHRCRRCGRCVEVCRADARRLVGRTFTLEELHRQLARDAPFYRHSGGGVTFSGGEPTLHARWAGELAQRLRAEGIPVLLETCGLFAFPGVAADLLPHLTQVYFDLKLADRVRHRRFTGQDNLRIHRNLDRLAATGMPVLARVPLVPGITDDPENLRDLARLVRRIGLPELALLPYNPLWLPKRSGLGLPAAYGHDRFMSEDELAAARAAVEQEGLRVHG